MPLELTITSLSHAGEGIARHAGRVIFVPFALPGEVVRAELTEEKRGFARAHLQEVLTPSPERVVPPCPHHFSLAAPQAVACGGCQLQHLAYPAQLRFKQQQVREQFQRVGGLADPPVRAILAAPAPLGYRNQIQFALSSEGRLGFRAAASHRIVPVSECPIAAPELLALFKRLTLEAAPELDQLTLRLGADGDALIVLEAPEEAPELDLDLPVSAALLRPDGTSLTLAGRDYLVAAVHGRDFKVSAGSFFQVNTAVAERLVDEVLAALALRGGETVLEVYCGVGLFSAFIAPLAGRLLGVEAFEPAVEDAAANLDEFDHIDLYAATAEEVLPALTGPIQAILVDPPRAGLAPEVTAALIALQAPVFVYVSCDPATLARDARRLAAGGYTVDYLQPLDMFPQTHHVECVARFSLAAS